MRPRGFTGIKSLYIKWIILFTGLIITAQGLTLLFTLRYVLPDIGKNLNEKLCRKAAFLQNMHREGMALNNEVLTLTGDTDINMYLFELNELPEDIGHRYRSIISLDMLSRAANGEIVAAYTSGSVQLPFCLFSLEGQIVLLTPNILSNDLSYFNAAYQRSLLASSLSASALIVFALLVIIRPIKKVTAATREVAGGNFNIQLETRSHDEVGELIHNFNKMTQALQKNEYLKKDFVSNVSHEFKTPITSIEGFARLMKNENATREELNEYADIIIRESRRLENLSSNLLQLSLLDSDSFEPPQRHFQLDEQIREAILILQSKWESKRIDFDIHMDELPYTGPEEFLSRVWVNLIDNAIKFSPSGGVITINAHRDGSVITISISDQGSGISREHAERIFERFYKVEKARSKEGSGLGLSIVKHILTLVNGNIQVGRSAGTGRSGNPGTCFTVTLPENTAR